MRAGMYYYSYYYYDCSCYDCWSLLMTTIVTAAIRQTCNRCTLPHTKAFREPCRRGKARRLEDVDVAQRQRRVEQCQQNAPKLSVPCQARLTPAVARNSGSPHRGESLSGGSTLGPRRSLRPAGAGEHAVCAPETRIRADCRFRPLDQSKSQVSATERGSRR